MSGLQLLRRILAMQAGSQAHDGALRLPPHELRFALEYPQAPDIAAERQALAELLNTDGFALQPLFEGNHDLGHILVLRFPGIERTLSREVLFSIAYEIADARGLVAAEPDLGARIYADPLEPGTGARPESADALGPLCWVDSDPPADKRWALATIGVLRAWARFPARGEGIRIAQPDTGVSDHREVDRTALDLAHAKDILDGDNDPTDPLTPGTANPGHGTGTASVVISRENGLITGSAPGAMLVPIRCTDDVKIFDGTPIAAAIEHATRTDCDVITMSLGGLPSFAVHAAVRAAVKKGAIVLAAAGNCVRLVVYPARYDEVIAVAGINVKDQPWLGSSRGSDVDISAPAELVWRADKRQAADPPTNVGGGQGTSFAVALTAGVAALWLSHHGRDAVRAEARRRGTTVQALFKAAMQATCRKPAIWDADDFGPGIVDAEQLLGLALGAIPQAAPEAAAPRTAESARRLLDDAGGVRNPDPAFDWKRYGLEVASMLYEDARFANPNPMSPEAGPSGVRPSPQLAAATESSSDMRLRALGARQARRGAGIVQLRTGTSAPSPNLIKILGRPRGQSFESAGNVTFEAAQANLRGDGIKHVLDQAKERMDAMVARDGSNPTAARLQDEVLSQGEEVLHRVVREGTSRVGGTDRAMLEALVSLTDRPAVRVENDRIDRDHPELGPWKAAYALAEAEINAAFLSVGRIDADGEHIGTGFVVSPGVIMTNRHVIEEFAAPIPKRTNPTGWVLQSNNVTIDFSDDARGGPTSFRIKSIISAGKQPIVDQPVEFTKLDMALLEVETTNAAGKALPSPLQLQGNADRVRHSSRIFTVGYPAKPQVLPTDASGAIRMDVVTRLRAIYGTKYGVKYFSPGIVSTLLGQVEGDGKGWVFNHDATTLGGNSGSAAFDLDGTIAIVGLHFAGDWLRANHAHAVAAVKASHELPRVDGFDWI
jgi:serine protease